MSIALIKKALLDRFGEYPVLAIDEYQNRYDYPDTYDYGDYAYFNLDTEKLETIENGFSYVSHLFMGLLRDLELNPKGRRFEANTSRKYSFGDTPDWWAEATIEGSASEIEGRIIIELEVGVHS